MKSLRSLLPFLFLIPSIALAWGEKGHYLANDAATRTAPPALPTFFHQAYPDLVYLSADPDRIRGGGNSIEDFNAPNHFLDYEYVEHLELPPARYKYIDLLYTSGTLRRFNIQNSTSGFAPWRLAELAEELTVQWRLWRRATDPVDRAQIEDNIVRIGGILGHFAADISNPHHATMNYNGWAEENEEGFRYDCETHSRFESQFVARAVELDDVMPHMRPLQPRTDYFAAAMETIRESNGLLRELYRIDRDGGFDRGEGTAQAREFAGRRLAAGASLLRDLWWSAWVNSANDPAPRRR
jgi:hypothetical protein